MKTKGIVVVLVLFSFSLGWVLKGSLQQRRIVPSGDHVKAGVSFPTESVESTSMDSSPESFEDGRMKQSTQKQSEPNAKYRNTLAVFETSKGKIVLQLFYDKAPKTVTDFCSFAEKGFYDGSYILKKEEGIGTSAGPMQKDIVPFNFQEEPGLGKSEAGSFAIARSSISPYYVNYLYFGYGVQPEYEKEFTIIGKTVEGLEILTQLKPGDEILSVKIIKNENI